VRLLVGLHVVESMNYNLHQIVLSGNQVLEIDGVVGVGVVRLAVAHMVVSVCRNQVWRDWISHWAASRRALNSKVTSW
jgi:hypothetical protein